MLLRQHCLAAHRGHDLLLIRAEASQPMSNVVNYEWAELLVSHETRDENDLGRAGY